MLGYKTSNHVLGVIPKMVYLFGTIFNDLRIPRMDSSGEYLNQLIRVPIIYGPKDKVLTRVAADPSISREEAVTLPIMSFEHVDTLYDHERKLSSMHKIVVKDPDNGYMQSQYTPVPYNFLFDLHLYAKNNLDLNNMLELILGFFTPEFTIRADLIPSMEKLWMIPVVYNNQRKQDKYEGKVEDRRDLVTTLHFTVKGYLFGPVVRHPVIKFANTTFYIPSGNNTMEEAIGNTEPASRVTVRPGLTANGEPTTVLEESVPLANIEADDNFGYIIDITGPLGANSNGGE
jgi:hypothetical protein